MTLRVCCLAACLLLPAPLLADDWPQWLGPDRDGSYHESGVTTQIPAAGLPVKWRAPAAHGYASPSVADGRVYLFEYEITEGELNYAASTRDELQGVERLRCLDAETGETLWKSEHEQAYNISYGGGPRCAPTVDGDRVYTLGPMGNLACLSA